MMGCQSQLGGSPAVNPAGRGLVLDALLTEYRNIHQRVLDQIQLYETTNIRILALLGVLFYFGIRYLNETADFYIFTIVNAVFIVLVPAIAFASVLFTGANLAKIMVWGDFLKTVENKVNRMLKPEAKLYEFPGERVMSWEFWRVEYGYAGGRDRWSIVTFSGLLVVAFLASAVASVYLRLQFIHEHYDGFHSIWGTWAIVIVVIFAVATVHYARLFIKKRAESLETARNDLSL